MDAEQLTTPFASLTTLITDVEQLASQQIGEQMMDVYQTRLDASLLFTDEYMDNITNLFDFSSLGVDAVSGRVVGVRAVAVVARCTDSPFSRR